MQRLRTWTSQSDRRSGKNRKRDQQRYLLRIILFNWIQKTIASPRPCLSEEKQNTGVESDTQSVELPHTETDGQISDQVPFDLDVESVEVRLDETETPKSETETVETETDIENP